MGTLRAHAPLAIAAAAIVIAGCTDDRIARSVVVTDPTGSTTSSTTGSTTSDRPGGSGTRVRGLQRFADCASFLDHVQAAARDRVGPYGLEGMTGYYGPPVMMEGDVILNATGADMAPTATVPASDVTARDSATQNSGGEVGADFTGTNVQEAGVDEPDIIKTDGERIIAISDQTLSYIDVSSGKPVVVDRLTIEGGWGHELFFAGDRALLFTNNSTWATPMPAIPSQTAPMNGEQTRPTDEWETDEWEASALITEVDLSDPTNLRIAATLHLEGQYLSARAIGDHVRLALSSGPQSLGWVYPSSPNGENNATEANRAIIDRTKLSDWTPSYTVDVGGDTTSGELLDCSKMHQPADFAGFEMISIVDLDIAEGLATSLDVGVPNAVGVLASGQTVYSSLDRMYVATTTWVPGEMQTQGWDDGQNDSYETAIHSFAIAPGEPTTYVASGVVPGSLLNQFALDEHNGYLRAITTSGAPWSSAERSESSLRVLAEDGDQLVEVGSVGGLGRGEQLYSARLMGDIGFAVTFRQVDPFYVLDLSDPFNPMVTAELKIPGFSSYLHPVGNVAESGLVLGVGQDASETGQVRGLKLSLFDVSDPVNPVERDVWTLDGGSSGAEYDHRAFQMIGSTAILPTQSWADGFAGATLFDVTAHGISELGRVSHDDAGFTGDGYRSSIQRSLVIADQLFTMSPSTLQANNLATLDVTATVTLQWPGDAIT